ncbi:hypothetical protein FG93_04897 [Bosea sp. LC85]|nr:hypothetical protein FG93_04897 [Bosea sp. LC85]
MEGVARSEETASGFIAGPNAGQRGPAGSGGEYLVQFPLGSGMLMPSFDRISRTLWNF